ncbi:hypothetical protein [Microlunatus ginsengisoli]
MIITIFDGDQPITLARLPDEDDLIVTSLRLPFASLDAGNRTAGRIVFWAARPGAFVDLAADLGHALNAPTLIGRLEPTSRKGRDGNDRSEDDHVGADHRGGHASIVLDADFPPHTPPPGLSGLDQLSTINRAIGILIDQGHNPDEALRALQRHAAAADVEPYVYAAQLLKR